MQYTSPMRVFGVDCGTEFTGYGVVEVDCEARMPRKLYASASSPLEGISR